MGEVTFRNPFSGATSTGSVMSQHKAGPASTGVHLRPGIPFVETVTLGAAGSTTVEFPSVARRVTIVATGNDIKVMGVATDDAAGGAVTLVAGTTGGIPFGPIGAGGAANSLTLDCRLKQVHLVDPGGGSTALIVAELTGADPASCPAWSWATGTGTVGETGNTARCRDDEGRVVDC